MMPALSTAAAITAASDVHKRRRCRLLHRAGWITAFKGRLIGVLTSAAVAVVAAIVLAVAATSAMAITVSAEGGPSVHDLATVYRQAQARDAVLEAARQQALAAAEKLPQARAALKPVISFGSSGGRQLGQASFAGAEPMDRGVRNSATTLQLTQPLLRRAAWIAMDQADAQVQMSLAQYAQARQEFILRVAQRYFDVLLARNGITVADHQLTAVRAQLDLAGRNFDVGVATVTDVHEARARHDLAKAQRSAAFNELESKQVELERITGESPGALSALRPDVELAEPQPADVELWVARARIDSPLVRMQEAARDAAEKEVAKADAAHWPTLDLTASYGRSFSAGSMTSPADLAVRNRVGQIGVQLSVPLYSGGALDSRAREAASAYARTQAEFDDAQRQAAGSARQAHASIANGRAQTEALASAVISSRSAVSANQMGYRIGTRINIDVLNAEQQLYAAQRDLAKSRVDTLMSGLRLKAAAGLLADEDIIALNTLLVPPPTAIPPTPEVPAPSLGEVRQAPQLHLLTPPAQ